jgi:hypothetical protein
MKMSACGPKADFPIKAANVCFRRQNGHDPTDTSNVAFEDLNPVKVRVEATIAFG